MGLLNKLKNPTGINTGTLSGNLPAIGRISNRLGKEGVELSAGNRFNPLTGDRNKVLPDLDVFEGGVPLKKVVARRPNVTQIGRGDTVAVRDIGYVPLDSVPRY